MTVHTQDYAWIAFFVFFVLAFLLFLSVILSVGVFYHDHDLFYMHNTRWLGRRCRLVSAGSSLLLAVNSDGDLVLSDVEDTHSLWVIVYANDNRELVTFYNAATNGFLTYDVYQPGEPMNANLSDFSTSRLYDLVRDRDLSYVNILPINSASADNGTLYINTSDGEVTLGLDLGQDSRYLIRDVIVEGVEA